MDDVIELTLPGGTACQVLELTASEPMNALSSWELVVLSDDKLAPGELLRAAATLTLRDPLEATTRQIFAVVVELVDEGEMLDGCRTVVVLAPRESLVAAPVRHRVFVDKTTQDIVGQVLLEGGIAPDRVTWRLAG